MNGRGVGGPPSSAHPSAQRVSVTVLEGHISPCGFQRVCVNYSWCFPAVSWDLHFFGGILSPPCMWQVLSS